MNPAPEKAQSLRGQVIDWLLRLKGAPDDEVLRAEFEAWLAQSDRHRRAYRTIKAIWQQAEELPPTLSMHPPMAPMAGPAPIRKRPAYYAIAAAAAACLLLLASPSVRLRLMADHLTGVAELGEVILDDGSRVTLDAASAIAIDYSADRREVKLLSGRAFFEVTSLPERPFFVAASDVNVMVTGTSFSVGMSDTGVSVAVETGKVSVSRRGNELAALRVGERLSIGPDGKPARGSINPDDVAVWRGQRIVVHEATVREVVEQIGRYMPGVIVFGDREIADRRVTGVIDLHRPLEALHAVVDLRQGRVLQISPYLTVISSR